MDAESGDGRCLSLPTTPCGSLSAGSQESPAQSADTGGSTPTIVPEESCKEQFPEAQDNKKDKAQKSWLRNMLNFVLRLGPEEPKEKTGRKNKGKEGHPSPTESPVDPELPVPRKKAPDKKGGHGRPKARETLGAQEQEARGHQAAPPGKASTPHSEEAPRGPVRRGRERASYHHSVLAQSRRRQPDEELRKPDKEAVIQMIVKFLQRVGDQYEIEQLQVPLPEVFEPNPGPPSKKKPPERKSSLKKVFSLKKQGSEEPKRTGAVGAASPESRPPRKPTLLGMCVGGQRPSIPSGSGLEEAEVSETLFPEAEDVSPADDHPRRAKSQTPEEVLAQDTVSESKEAVIQMIVKFLQRVGDQYEIEQLQAPLPEVFEPNPVLPSKKKPSERKTSLKRVFSLKKQGSEEPKRAAGLGATSLESRPPRRPTFLALCVGGQRPSTPSISELLIIQKLEAFLQEVGEQLGEQIRRHPCLKRYFQEILDSCQEKLVAAMRSQEGHSSHPGRNPQGPYQFPFDLPNKFAGNSHNVISLLDLLGHYRRRRSSQYSYEEAQPNITSPDIQIESPD
ncbi:protein BNIP5 [Sorex fumeus]|uniref:protein BNIP5 n=1 Tax=Sorex fumeus TaxID=62283 RepID=UPI0024AD5EEC|nr:protein BNIP5 [Sorex fumeus]